MRDYIEYIQVVGRRFVREPGDCQKCAFNTASGGTLAAKDKATGCAMDTARNDGTCAKDNTHYKEIGVRYGK